MNRLFGEDSDSVSDCVWHGDMDGVLDCGDTEGVLDCVDTDGILDCGKRFVNVSR